MVGNVSVQIESEVPQPPAAPKEVVYAWTPRTVAWYGVLLGFPGGLALAVRNWKALKMDRQVHRHVIGGFVFTLVLIPPLLFVSGGVSRIVGIGLTFATYSYLKTTFTSDIATAQLTYDVRYRPWYSGIGWALFGLVIFFTMVIGAIIVSTMAGFNIPD